MDLALISEVDIVVDGTDNLPVKYLINDACVLAKKPLVYGSIADQLGDTQLAYVIMIPCYLFILFYATIGHKKSSW